MNDCTQTMCVALLTKENNRLCLCVIAFKLASFVLMIDVCKSFQALHHLLLISKMAAPMLDFI